MVTYEAPGVRSAQEALMFQGEMDIRVGHCQPVLSYKQQLSTHGVEQQGEHVTSHSLEI